MWTKDNSRVPLGAIIMISKGCFRQISNFIIKFVFRSFLYLNPSTVDVVLNWYRAHTLIKFWGEMELVHVLLTTYSAPTDCQLQTKNLLRSLCTHLNECAELLSKRLEGKFQIYLEWSWQLISLGCFFQWWILNICLFFLLQMWTIKLTESTNNFFTSDRAICTVKVNMKERFTGNGGFLQIFMWWINCSQRIKELLLDKFRF